MKEKTQPDSWLNELADLIIKKKEENELLKKLSDSLELPISGAGLPAKANDEVKKDEENGELQ
jgi:hypothetical protein